MQSLRHWRYLGWDSKSRYQGNMLRSMALTYLAFILTVLVLFVWPLGGSGSGDEDSNGALADILGNAVTDEPSAAARGNPRKDLNPDVNIVRGDLSSLFRFLGHNNLSIRVVRDELVRSSENISLSSDWPVENDPGHPIITADISYDSEDGWTPYSAGIGGSDLFGLGDNTFGLPNGLAIPSQVRLPSVDDYRSDIDDRPVFLGLAVPVFPMDAKKSDTGRVVVDVTVDRDGHVSYKILSVSPRFLGFAYAVERAIQRGEYAPRVVRGISVEHTTRLTLIMGYNQDPTVDKSTAVFDAQTADVNAVWLEKK